MATLLLLGSAASGQVTGVIEADVSVHENAPSQTFGRWSDLLVDPTPPHRAQTLFRVRVSGTGSQQVLAASLSLQVVSSLGGGSDSGGSLQQTSCTWDENTVTWDSMPLVDSAVIDSVGALRHKAIVSLDITNTIRTDGVYCFALVGDGGMSRAVTYASREARTGRPTVQISVGLQPTSTTTTSSSTSSSSTTTSSSSSSTSSTSSTRTTSSSSSSSTSSTSSTRTTSSSSSSSTSSTSSTRTTSSSSSSSTSSTSSTQTTSSSSSSSTSSTSSTQTTSSSSSSSTSSSSTWTTSSSSTSTTSTTIATPTPCGAGTGPLITLTGTFDSSYSDPSLLAGTTIDARSATFLASPVNTYPLNLGGEDGVCVLGGAVLGQYDRTLSWTDSHTPNNAAISFLNGLLTIDGARIDNVTDGIRPRAGDSFTIRNAWLSYIRDDCVENDHLQGGLIDDTLFDGCYVAFSARPSPAIISSGYNGAGKVWTIQNSLIRLQPMPGPDGATPDGLGHAGFFKWHLWGDPANSLSPKLALHGNVFMAERVGVVGADRMGIPPGELGDCSDNVMVWLGPGDYPATLPPACFTVTKDPAVWDSAVADWLARHVATP